MFGRFYNKIKYILNIFFFVFFNTKNVLCGDMSMLADAFGGGLLDGFYSMIIDDNNVVKGDLKDFFQDFATNNLGLPLKDDPADPKNSSFNLKNLLPGILFAINPNAKTNYENGKTYTKSENNVYYINKPGNDNLPLIVWFHGNGADCAIPEEDGVNIENTVFSIEYPNYIEGRLGKFNELDTYTDEIVKFIEKTINSRAGNKEVILLSHSLGCNFNALTFEKLRDRSKDKKNNIPIDNIKSIMFYPYYSAIDASSVILKNKVQLTGKEPNGGVGDSLADIIGNLGDFGKMIAGDNANNMIDIFLNKLYSKIYSDNLKDVKGYPKDTTELEQINHLTNNAHIISSTIEFIEKEIAYFAYGTGHNDFSFKADYPCGIENVKISDLFTDINLFKFRYTDQPVTKNLVLINTEKDQDIVVGNGAFQIFFNLLFRSEVEDNINENLNDGLSNEQIQKYKNTFGCDLSSNEFAEFQNLRNQFPHLKNMLQEMQDLDNKDNSSCRCLKMCAAEQKGEKPKDIVTDTTFTPRHKENKLDI